MASPDDSGVGSALQTIEETPVSSKVQKRSLASTPQSSTSTVKKQRLSLDGNRSEYTHFQLDLSIEDLVVKQKIESERIEIGGAKWYMDVRKKKSSSDSVDSSDSPSEKSIEFMMEVCVRCEIPSAVWTAECSIEIEATNHEEKKFRRALYCKYSQSEDNRGILLDWRKSFMYGGHLSAKILVVKVCHKYLHFPDFTDPTETGRDELYVGDTKLYVDKNLLMLHSKFFARLFCSSEDGPYRLEGNVKDVVETLRTVYPQKGQITDSNACTIAMIAKEFHFYDTLERCEQYILNSPTFTGLERIQIALRCDMHDLLESTRPRLVSLDEIMGLMGGNEIGFEIDQKTKAFLFDSIVALDPDYGKKEKENSVKEVVID